MKQSNFAFMAYCLFAHFSLFTTASAAGYGLQIGPGNFGMGGSNPVSGNPTDFEAVYVTSSQKQEWSISLNPGIFWAYRETLKAKAHISLGGGIVMDANLIGVGVMSAFGVDLWCPWKSCLTLEYKQALTIGPTVIAPYAVRLGIFLWTK